MTTLVDCLVDRVGDPAPLLSFHRAAGGPPVRMSYGQSVWLGSALLDLDRDPVPPGSRVILILPQGPALSGAFFAALWHGLVPSILAYPTFKMSADLYHAQIEALTRHLAAARIATDARVAERLAGLPVHVVPEGLLSGAPWPEDARPAAAPHAPGLDEVAFLQHSAGTTGLQKGVALSHRAVVTHVHDYAKALALQGDDRVASWLPLYHDMGLIACLVMPMVQGLPSATMSPADWVMRPGSFLGLLEAERATLAWWPNFTYPFLAKRATAEEAAHRLDHVRRLVDCSEPVTRAAFDAFLERFAASGAREDQLHASYAMAENTFAVTQTLTGTPTLAVDRAAFEREGRAVPDPGSGMRWTSSGRLFAGNELRIVGADGQDLAEGRVGEAYIRSPYMLTGYWGREDLTAQAIRGGWYATGDLAFVHDGEVYVTGRARDLIIIGGRNLYPQDIEEVVGRDPDLHDGRVVAVGVPNDAEGTEDLVIAAETHAPEEATAERAALVEARVRKAIVAQFEVSPRRVVVVPPMWLLKSSAGKISRKRNREKLIEMLSSDPEAGHGAAR